MDYCPYLIKLVPKLEGLFNNTCVAHAEVRYMPMSCDYYATNFSTFLMPKPSSGSKFFRVRRNIPACLHAHSGTSTILG